MTTTEVVYEASPYFPAIDICNLNPYISIPEKLTDPKTLKKQNLTLANNFYGMTVFRNYINTQMKYLSHITELYEAGFKLDKILISCSYEG